MLLQAQAASPEKAVPSEEEVKRAREQAMEAMGAALVQANAAIRLQHEADAAAEKAADGKTVKAVEADAELVELAEKDAKVLEPLLKDDWEVVVKRNEIVLTSKFEVFSKSHYGALTNKMPEFSDALSRDELLAHVTPEKYVFRLEYARALTREEYEKRLAERQVAALAMAFGPWSKHEAALAQRLLGETRVPRYQRQLKFHVYESNSDLLSGRLFPPASVRKIGAAKAILAEELRLLPGGTDATSGR